MSQYHDFDSAPFFGELHSRPGSETIMLRREPLPLAGLLASIRSGCPLLILTSNAGVDVNVSAVLLNKDFEFTWSPKQKLV